MQGCYAIQKPEITGFSPFFSMLLAAKVVPGSATSCTYKENDCPVKSRSDCCREQLSLVTCEWQRQLTEGNGFETMSLSPCAS